MEKTFEIKIIKERKINSIGTDFIAIGFFSLIIFIVIGIPYYPDPIENVPFEINLSTLIAIIAIFIGALIANWKKFKTAKLCLTSSGIEITGEVNLNIPFNEIIEISDLRPGLKSRNKHFRLSTKNKNIDIRAGKDLSKYLAPFAE